MKIDGMISSEKEVTETMNEFLYETHLHTSEGSACGKNTGAEMARAYAAAGYAGIIVTDHFFYGNTAVDRTLPWEEWVRQYCLGYEHAKEEGDKLGLSVFFGWEAGYRGPEFLVYGLDPKWLAAHPQIRDASVEEQLDLVHADGGIVVQAHPYREAPYIRQIELYPEFVDAIEGINASHSSLTLPEERRHPEYNERALALAKEHSLPLTGGSDQHSITMLGGGMVFSRRLSDIHDFIRAVLGREAVRLLDGTESA